jgi:hypothetical protein
MISRNFDPNRRILRWGVISPAAGDEPEADAVILVEYPGRVCELLIDLQQPLEGKVPTSEEAITELRHLRDALNEILREPEAHR